MEERFRSIDLDHWARREHYELFRRYGFPFFSITTDIDITPLHKALKERSLSFTVGFVYLLARTANAVPEFRQRIREPEVIEHEVVHPGLTVLCEGDVFRFCFLRYLDNFERFAGAAAEGIEETRRAESLGKAPGRDDLLYLTALPWFAFTGMTHPLLLDPSDSVPRIAWGRFEEKENLLIMPLNVQAHHALIDGIHIAKFIERLQELIQTADSIL